MEDETPRIERVVSERDAEMVVRLLTEDADPNDALRRAAERYRSAEQDRGSVQEQ